MATETLRAVIAGDATGATRAFKETADTAVLAARGAKLLADELKHQARSAKVAEDATYAMARADAILAVAENRVEREAKKADRILEEQRLRLKGRSTLFGGTGGIRGALGGIGGGIGGIGSLGGQGLSGGLGAVPFASNPWAGAGILAGAAASAPFLGQIAGGGIITALGGGLAALGIAGALITQKVKPAAVSVQQLAAAQNRLAASQDRLNALQRSGKATSAQLAAAQASMASAQDSLNKLQAKNTAAKNFAAEYAQQLRVQKAFSTLKDHATDSLAVIGRSFTPVLLAIATTADDVLHTLTPVFAGAVKTISKPFSEFADVLIRTFARPDVKKSIQDVADAFSAILTAVTPALGSTIGNVAIGISKIAKAISANPQVFASFVQFLGMIAGGALTAIAWLTKVANYIEAHFAPAMHRVAVIFDGVRHEIAHVWDQIYENSAGIMIRLGHNIETQFNSWRHGIAVVFDGIRHDIAHYWDMLFSNTIGRVQRGFHDIAHWFDVGRHQIAAVFNGARTWLLQTGKDVIQGLWDGFTFIWRKVTGWISGLAGWIKAHKGPLSLDRKLLEPAGRALMHGLKVGLLGGFTSIADIISGVAGTIAGKFAGLGGKLFGKSGTVTGWIEAALIQAGKPISWLPALQVLVSKESGGNPGAVNPVSVLGQHATGMWQMLPSTYFAFGGPPGEMGNPVVEGIAALKYIAATYGSPFNIPGLLSGTYMGYDAGGVLPPGFHLVANLTGRNEQVIPAGGGRAGGGNMHVHLHNHGVIGSQAELDNWLHRSVDRLAMQGRLSWALRQSPSAP